MKFECAIVVRYKYLMKDLILRQYKNQLLELIDSLRASKKVLVADSEMLKALEAIISFDSEDLRERNVLDVMELNTQRDNF